MGVVTREMLEFGLMDPNTLVKCIVSVGPFPFPGLEELRGKHRALISQDTPYKSFFLAKRELDNLKRHYTAIRHRQRATTIILKNLEPKSISGFRSSRNLTHSNSNSGSGGLSVPGNKKAGSVSPKPKPRRLNSGGKSVILGENNNRNVTPYNNNKGKRLNQNQLGNKPQQQITLPWDSSTKKPKNFRQRQASASSSYSSSSSSSSTELCDSSLSEDDSSDTEPEKQMVKPPKKEEVDAVPSPEITKTKDEQMDEILDQEGNRKSRQNSTNSEKFEQNQIKNQEESNETDQMNRSLDNKLNENVEKNHASAMAKIPTINLSQEDATPADLMTSPSFEPPLDLSPKSAGVLDPDESEQLQEIIHPNNENEIDPNKVIDTNDSQHFLEEMSRLGKSDSFYENLSHRICQLQFQNLRILTTCNTIPDPVIMPNIDYSPLPSPMSPVPPRPMTPNLAYSANLNVPFQRSKLVLSPSLNHLSLSTSRRSSLSSNASQPGSPMLNRSPIGSLENSSKSPSRRHSKSSMSSQDTEEGAGHLSKMNSSSIENDVVVPAVTVDTGLMSATAGQRPTTPSQDPKDFDLSLPIPSRSSSMSKITHQDAVDESRDAKDNEEAMYHGGKEGNQGQTTEDINDVIRANIAILQRLKLKPAYDDFFDDDSSSTSFVTEFSDDETVDPLEQDLAKLTPKAGTPIRLTHHKDDTSGLEKEETNATIDVNKCQQTLVGQERVNPNAPKLSVGRHRPTSRTRSRSRSTSQQRSFSVCSHCCANNVTVSSGMKKRDARNAQSVSLDSNSGKNKKSFNPFPTTRKARPRTTKFGLYA